MKQQRIQIKLKSPSEHIGFGYGIAETDNAAKTALGLASDLVSEASALGSHLRSWGIEARERTRQLLKLGDQMSRGMETPLNVQEFIVEILKCEQNISGSIRQYFLKISDLLHHLKMLNPPLTSQQLDPYMEAILADRRVTMVSLEPLSDTIQKIAALKTQVWFGEPISQR